MNATVRKLAQLLESSDLEIRIAAIRVITEMGLDTRQVVQALARSLREPHDDLRLAALKALARLGARDVSSMVVPLILTSGPLREHAMAVITAVGQSVVPQLKSLYPQADFHGKRSVITALSRISGKAAISFLLKILPEEPFELQKHLTLSVCEALDRMPPPQQAPVYSMVLRLLRSKEAVKQPQLLITGAILLGHFRGASLGLRARNELRSLAEKKVAPEVRRHAIVSYNRLLAEAKMAPRDEQFLVKALCDEDWHNVAQHALSGFQKLPVPRQHLPRLVDLLHKSPHFSVHIHVFERLQTSDRSEVAEAILPFLADSRFRVREAAEAALRKMPASIESLFALLMKTDDLEVTQRINAILRDFPQETRQKYVERAASRLLSLFEENDPHYRSFLDFVKSLDPEPLRKRIYAKAHELKKGKVKDKWERIALLLQLLWDNHLITAEGRYLLAVALVRMSPKDLAPASRRANLGLRVLRSLIYDDYQDLAKRLKADKDLGADDHFYLGFHFSEEGEELRPFATLILEHVVKAYPKSKVAGPAAHKLDLQAKAKAAAAAEAAAAREAAEKKAERKQKKLAKEAAALAAARAQGAGAPVRGGTPAASPAPGLAKPKAAAPPKPAAVAKAAAPPAKPAAKAPAGKAPAARAGEDRGGKAAKKGTGGKPPAIRRAKTGLAAAKKASKAKRKKR
jgi:hypothetical protein